MEASAATVAAVVEDSHQEAAVVVSAVEDVVDTLTLDHQKPFNPWDPSCTPSKVKCSANQPMPNSYLTLTLPSSKLSPPLLLPPFFIFYRL